MPAVKLSRALIRVIEENSSADCVEIDGLDLHEQNLAMLSQLLAETLQ